MIDAAVLVAIFAGYAWRLSQAPAEEPIWPGSRSGSGQPAWPAAWLGGRDVRAGQFLRRRRDTARLLREGLITKFSELSATPR